MTYQTELIGLRRRQLHRSLRSQENAQGPRLKNKGKTLLNFSSNDYLGLSHDRALIEASVRACRKWGTGSGASRLICGSLKIHHDLEESIASFKKEERGLIFTSGFMANGVIASLVGAGDTVWVDRHCHASLVDASRLSGATLKVYPHRDLERLNDLLSRRRSKRNLVVTESFFSMEGDVVNLKDLLAICRKHDAEIYVDEAHATGVMGPGGRGMTESFGVEGQIDFVMGTFSKALGSQGGFVTGRSKKIEYLINKARTFIYTTGPSPANSAASLKALEICTADSKRRERLWYLANLLRRRLSEEGFKLGDSVGPILPVLVGDTQRALDLSKRLYELGFLIPAIRPPTVPKGSDRLRITVSAKHTEDEVNQLACALKEIFKT
jgi:8-amino-7-oxononanoate synthase